MSAVAFQKLERPALEVNLTEHCNLSCYACDHASPLLPRRLADLDAFVGDLGALSRVFHAGEIRLVGGEPLLHPRVVDFAREAADSGVADRIVVYTNGVLLHRMPQALWDLIDDLRVSVYPGVERTLSLEACAIVCAERGIRFEADAKHHQFQQSLLNGRIEDRGLVQSVFRRCQMAGELSCHAVHEGRFYRCSVSPFQGPRLARLGISFENRDGVALHDNPRLREELERCLVGEEPLGACDFCLGTLAPWTPHRQLDEEGLARWLAEDPRGLIEQVRRKLEGEGG